MASPPAILRSGGNYPTDRPRLPSFSNFLSSTGHSAFAPVQTTTTNPAAKSSTPSPSFYRPADEQQPTRFPVNSPPARRPSYDASGGLGWPPIQPASRDGNAFQPSRVSRDPPPSQPYARTIVGEENIPGKGMCYVYDDGSVCQKAIGGEVVNPRWGTTKAGKPRKRLSQACNHCREKKIKCEPGVPKCAQCQRFGRECKFDPMSRSAYKYSSTLIPIYPSSHPSSTDTTQLVDLARRNSTPSSDATAKASPLTKRGSMPALPLESLLSPTADSPRGQTEPGSPPAKKACLSMPDGHESPRAPPAADLARKKPSLTPASEDSPPFSWKVDPYEVDPMLTLSHLNWYLSYLATSGYSPFPAAAFTRWVQNCRTKSPADRMMLYAILAMSAQFLRRSDAQDYRAVFSEIVYHATAECADSISLQLVQTRVILAITCFASGDYVRAFNINNMAIRCAFALRINTEEGVKNVDDTAFCDFDYDTLVECRRRIMWAAYVMDCFSAGCDPSHYVVAREDCRLRLPCPVAAFETGEIPVMPFHLTASSSDGDKAQPNHEREIPLAGFFGHVVELATIFHDVVQRSNRRYDSAREGPDDSLETLNHLKARLSSWLNLMKQQVPFLHDEGINSEPYNRIQLLYHYTCMSLHRYVWHSNMDRATLEAHVTGAYYQAKLLLETMQRVSNYEQRNTFPIRVATTHPFGGFAVSEALDIVTAGGTLSDLMNDKSEMMALVSCGLEALENLQPYWQSARRQRDAIKQRLAILLSTSAEAADSNGAFFFEHSMQNLYSPEQDVVYGIPRIRYFQALGWDDRIRNEGDFRRLDQGNHVANSAD